MTNRRALSSLFLVLFFLNVNAQEKDFGIWYNANFEMELAKNLEFDFWGSVRTYNRASKVEEAFGEMGLGYKISKRFSVGGKYRFTEKIEKDNIFHPRHKWIGEFKAKFDISRTELSGRVRFQRQDKTYYEDSNDEIPDYYLRLKLKAVYRTPSFPVNPYASVESFSRVFEQADYTIEKYRICLGLEYKIGKKNSFDLEYLFQKDYQPDLSCSSILGIGYKFKL